MKKYITAFFTFVGYVTFLFAMGAGIVLYIGHRKSQAAEAAVMSTQDGQVVSLTPEKQADTLTTQEQTLPHFQPISRKPLSATKTKPVRKPTPTVSAKPATASVSAPATYAAPKVRQTVIVEKAAPKAPRKKRTTPKPTPVQEYLPPCTLTWRATDNTASPRTGRRGYVPNVHETTELEKKARQMEELRQAAELIRNPPVWESGVLKFFGGK